MILSTTRVFAVIGDPVEHSLSPAIQNPAFQAIGVDAIYAALPCAREDLPAMVRVIARARGGGNVTLPHKEAAAAVIDEPSDLVVRTGACNTFWLSQDQIHGDNTDVAGVRGASRSLLGKSTAGLRALLLGAGGAARAVLVALLLDDVAEVVIRNRDEGRAERLAGELGGGRTSVIGLDGSLTASKFDLVVNATSLGLSKSDPEPLDLGSMPPPGAVLDLVYRPDETALVRTARALGIRAADGGEMLVLQGAAAFERWWNRPAPVEVMMAALERARSQAAGAHS